MKRAKTAKTSPFHPFSDAQKECPALFRRGSLLCQEFQDLKRRVCSLESSQWLHIDRKGRKIPSWDHEGIHHFYSFLINYPQIIQSDILIFVESCRRDMKRCSPVVLQDATRTFLSPNARLEGWCAFFRVELVACSKSKMLISSSSQLQLDPLSSACSMCNSPRRPSYVV